MRQTDGQTEDLPTETAGGCPRSSARRWRSRQSGRRSTFPRCGRSGTAATGASRFGSGPPSRRGTRDSPSRGCIPRRECCRWTQRTADNTGCCHRGSTRLNRKCRVKHRRAVKEINTCPERYVPAQSQRQVHGLIIPQPQSISSQLLDGFVEGAEFIFVRTWYTRRKKWQ